MSDQDRNFAGRQPSESPAQPNQEPEDLAKLFDEVAPEDFSAEPPQPAPPAETPPPAREERAPAFNGYEPNIEAKRREIEQLEEKMDRFRDADSPYIISDAEGNRQYDFASFNADQMKWNKLRRQLDDLKERARERRDAGREQQNAAAQLARTVLNEKLGRSTMPKRMKDATVKLYRQAFDSMTSQGVWQQAQFGDRSKLRAGLAQLLDTVIGQVVQQQYAAGDVPPDERGLDASNGGEPPPPPKEEEEDEVTKAILEAHARRGTGRKTIGQLRREREAAAKGGQ